MIKAEDVFKIGKLGKPHGFKGEMSFFFDDDVFDTVDADYLILDIDGILVPFFMEEYRFRSDSTALIKFLDVDTRDNAQELTNCDVYFPYALTGQRQQQISWTRIIGFNLVDGETGTSVGVIEAVDDSTVNVLFAVRTAERKEILIPASEELILEVDMEKRVIKAIIPDGLLQI